MCKIHLLTLSPIMKKTSDKKILTFMQDVLYHIAFGVWYVLSILPAWMHYAASSVMAFLMYRVVRYRRKVVRKNLTASFPNMSKKELKDTEKRFYAHFCDIMVESVMYFAISEKKIKERMQFKGLELLEESCKNGKSCGIFLGHYANWEWVSSLPVWVSLDRFKPVQLYHPLENPIFDRLIGYTRSRMGGVNIPVNESLRHLVRYRKEGKSMIIGFIADQVPHWRNIHYWTNFLNHPETPVFTGAERLMRQFGMDVYYLDVQKLSRGKYVAEFKLISDNPNEVEEFGLTEIYTRMLEETINRQPEYWLWSHNRWKRTKEEWIARGCS